MKAPRRASSSTSKSPVRKPESSRCAQLSLSLSLSHSRAPFCSETHHQTQNQPDPSSQLNVFYLHSPDPTIDLPSQLRGVDTAHKRGLFRRFGLSNFSAAQVRAAHAHCAAHGYILPTVYQGNYSPVARLQETQVLPTLRALGIAFNAYSPVAGGFLTKTPAQVRAGGAAAGRLGLDGPLGRLYSGLYGSPAMLEGLDAWQRAADRAGCGKAELAYRWVVFDSALSGEFGDGVVLGARSVEQVRDTLGWFEKGSVGPEAKALIDDMWEIVKSEAVLNNVTDQGDYPVKVM